MAYVLVTGASSGVGREVAILLSKTYHLVLCGRNEERLEETKKFCDTSSHVVLWKYDFSQLATLEADFSQLMKEHAYDIAGFVHCAGVLQMLPSRMISLERLETEFSVNVFSAAILTKLLASRRVNAKNLKSVVYISSNISNRGARAFSMYGASKAALDGLMRNLAVELAPRVRVNSVLPGAMRTKMTEQMFSDADGAETSSKLFSGCIGTPRQIADVVAFLLSDQAGWVNGQQITVDGGRNIDLTEHGT